MSPFKGNTNTGYQQGIKIYHQATREIENLTNKMNIYAYAQGQAGGSGQNRDRIHNK